MDNPLIAIPRVYSGDLAGIHFLSILDKKFRRLSNYADLQ